MTTPAEALALLPVHVEACGCAPAVGGAGVPLPAREDRDCLALTAKIREALEEAAQREAVMDIERNEALARLARVEGALRAFLVAPDGKTPICCCSSPNEVRAGMRRACLYCEARAALAGEGAE